MRLEFLGANRQVTGSHYYLRVGKTKLFIDCGMFQEREFLDRNWEPSPIPPRDVDAVLLTHAHLDHSGLLPKLVREGFRGPVYTTTPSADLVEVMLRDAAEIQVEDAAYKKRRHQKEGRRGRHPEIPLYTVPDAEKVLPRLRPVAYGQHFPINSDVEVAFHDAGHILGSASVELLLREKDAVRRMIFSGDLGQWDMPILNDPTTFSQADYIVMESTYGDRDHDHRQSVQAQLERIVRETVEAGGNVVIPVFAVERAQELIFHLSRLYHAGRLPDVPVFLDSPMAVRVTDLFHRHREHFDAETRELMATGQSPLGFPGLTLVSKVEQSKKINRVDTPAIIMAPSGMCTAGRIKFHLRQNVGRPESTILFVGYQARGTLGRQILDRQPEVRIHGRYWPLLARVEQVHGVSGHADRSGLLRWVRAFREPPRALFLTHGEDQASESLAAEVRQTLGWNVAVPEYRQTVELA